MFLDLFYNDHFRPYWSAPVGGYGNSLMGAIGLSLSTDKSVYRVGESPIYRITGAIPGSVIAWSSTKNNQQTGEYQASYGDIVDANGTAEVTGGAWTADDIGQWTKTAMILKDDGSYDLSNPIAFSVIAASAAQPGTNPPTVSGDFLADAIDYLKENPLVGVGVGLGAYLLFFKKGR